MKKTLVVCLMGLLAGSAAEALFFVKNATNLKKTEYFIIPERVGYDVHNHKVAFLPGESKVTYSIASYLEDRQLEIKKDKYFPDRFISIAIYYISAEGLHECTPTLLLYKDTDITKMDERIVTWDEDSDSCKISEQKK
ncbi:MAG: hypothetical protein JSR85_01260 [Proteobacteria bacterium]|nr:hypothetical protein [Pseudomonadota bacterium]